jgi:ribose/xylose/arabinose/galactoside ABC-type transport system permease subunit
MRTTAVAGSFDDDRRSTRKVRLRSLMSWVSTVFGPFLGLVLITVLFAVLTRESGSFLSLYNWRTIAVQTVIVGTAALGMTIIMIAGGIDLSAGSTVALVTVCIAVIVKKLNPSMPVSIRDMKLILPLAMLLGIAIGGVCGAVNGALIANLRVVPFIVTLGSYKVYRGLAKWLASSTTVYIPSDAKAWWFTRILATEPEPRWLLVAPGVWVLLVLSVLLAMTLRYSLLGRYVYAVGSNEATARLCGINVPFIKVVVYAMGGLAMGLAGVLQFVYLGATGDPTTADGLELQVIAAVVIGGGSLSGGEGTVLGTLIGCLIISVLNNGCVHAGIPNPIQDIIIGTIIVAAVTLDRLRHRY